MNCFNHNETTAIGSCKHCSKGLCKECLTDLGHGLACRDIHENEVNELKLAIDQSVKIYSNAGKNSMIGPVFYLFMGVVFFIYGIVAQSKITNFLTILGGGFIVFAIVIFIRNWQLYAKNKNA